MIRLSWMRSCKGRLLAITVTCVFLFGFTSNYRAATTGTRRLSKFSYSDHGYIPSLRSHPFDNKCKFPIINSYASDLNVWSHAERLRTLKCPTDYPMATMDAEGAIYVHPHYVHYPKKEDQFKCKVIIMEGALRDPKTNKGKDVVHVVATLDAPENSRFFVNANVFNIQCVNKNNSVIWEKPFPGMFDSTKEKNTLIPLKDTPNFDQFGRKIRRKKAKKLERLSIDILGFDSTSRSMFQRHLPTTWETMHRLGYEVLYGYNKIGDNSMVNLAPILAGDVKEALENPKLDASGDINKEWILPTTKKLDPTLLPFLWKWMSKEFGCKSMLNEDISRNFLGLFHYPPSEFQPGFTESPTDHFYRAYYLNVYKNWTYGPCRDGSQIQKEFVDLWYRFASRYRDICHFGFTFVTTLTHEQPFLLETIDEHISQRLESLNANGVLDNSLSIILGDHGNRIGLIQYSYSGRIEERMPLMAIRIPPRIKELYPEEYRHFQENKYKLTSNFDIHQTLVDIAEMKFGKNRPLTKSRGISLFREIPEKRTCYDAYVPENFCSCLVDRSELKDALPGKPLPKPEGVSRDSLVAIGKWIVEQGLEECLNMNSTPNRTNFTVIGLNPLARHGLRTKENVTIVQQARDKNPPKMDFLWHESVLPLEIKTAPSTILHFLFRVENDVSKNIFTVNFEPSIVSPPPLCPFKSIFDVCDCLGLL